MPAYNSLRQAIFELREIPDKSKLEDLINEAEKIDIDKYTDETAEAFTAALANAKSVFENKNTSDAEVKAAERCFVQQLMVCRKRKLIRKNRMQVRRKMIKHQQQEIQQECRLLCG